MHRTLSALVAASAWLTIAAAHALPTEDGCVLIDGMRQCGSNTMPPGGDTRRPIPDPDKTRPTCRSGFVRRLARPTDLVCVTPQIRQQTSAENALAAARREPGGGAYGPMTCRTGFVWREAYTGDTVCVPPSSRAQARADNAAAPGRVAR